MVGSQIGSLIPDLSFGHNLCFKYPNGSCKPILDIFVPRDFQWYDEIFNLMNCDPCNRHLKIRECIGTPTLKGGISLGSVGVHSLTLFYISESVNFDFQASLLAHTFVNICLGRKPKAKVATPTFMFMLSYMKKQHITIFYELFIIILW